jgi:hypothetical protein
VWSVNVSSFAPPPPSPPPLQGHHKLVYSPPAPAPVRANPTPVPTPNITYGDCGTVMVGVSYNGNDIKSIETGSIDACCKACAATAGCKAWSFCSIAKPDTCGTPGNPVDCYLKTGVPAKPGTRTRKLCDNYKNKPINKNIARFSLEKTHPFYLAGHSTPLTILLGSCQTLFITTSSYC